jgi:hypothetical protein
MARIGKNQLLKLQSKYKTDETIGRLYGISRQAVQQLRIKYGILPVQDRNSIRDKEIVEMYKKGIAGTKLASKFKLSVTHTYRIIAAAGINCSQNPIPGHKSRRH